MSAVAENIHGRPFGDGALPKATAIAAMLEIILVGGAVWWLVYAHHTLPAAVKAPMHISLVTLPSKPKLTLKPKPVVQPKPKPIHHIQHSKPLPKPKPKPVHHMRHPKPKPLVKPMPKPAKVVPVRQVTPPPQPVQDVSASPDAMALFAAKIKAAVQAAVRYPPAARMLNRQGQSRVAFDYLDGKISNPHLVQSSGFPMLDRAAVAAVRSASYPMPIPKLLHHLLHMSVWVQFREVDQD